MGSAQIQQIPVGTTPVQAWVGVPNSDDQITYWNQDINNAVYLGFQPTITVNGGNTLPVPPNASFQLPASRTVFVIGASSGIKPLVVIPSSGNMFRSLTAGLGSLAIPSVFSPNYVPGVSGWSIKQDGSAEFNNLTVRGNTVFADGFLSNGDGTLTTTPGLFIYSGTPAAGNLIYSNTTASTGHDKFNNNYLGRETGYNNNTLIAANYNAEQINYYTFTANPNAVFTIASAALAFEARTLPILGATSGLALFNYLNLQNNCILFGDANSMLNAYSLGGDQNVYIAGSNTQHLANNAAAITLASFTAILTQQLAAGINYRFKAKVFFQGNAAGGQAVLSMSHGNGATNTLCGARAMFGPSGGGQGGLTFVTHAATFPGDQTDPIVLTNGGLGVWEIDGYTNCTGSGSLIISGAQVGGGNWTPLSGSFFAIRPVS